MSNVGAFFQKTMNFKTQKWPLDDLKWPFDIGDILSVAKVILSIFRLILKCLILSDFGQKSNKLRNLWRFWLICGHFWPFLAFELTLFDNLRVFLGGFWLFWWFSGIFGSWSHGIRSRGVLKLKDHVAVRD